MKSASRDFEFTRGDDYTHRIEFVDTNGQPLYWAAMTFAAQLRRAPDNIATVAFTIDETQLAFGAIELSLSEEVTETLSGAYVWDLERIDGAGKRVTLVAGNVYVRADVTRLVGS